MDRGLFRRINSEVDKQGLWSKLFYAGTTLGQRVEGETVMMSNERPSYGYPGGGAGSRTGVPEETLKTEKIQIERKTFVFALKENPRGRFLRITEDVSGRRDTIIIPAPGLEDFKNILEQMVKVSTETPPKS